MYGWVSFGVLYSIGSSIQYAMVNHNGKEYLKMCVYVCVYV